MTTPAIVALEHRDAGAALRRQASPIVVALVGDQLLGIVDTIAIGALGTAALAAITGASAVFMVLGIGLFAFGSGLRILGAQAIGAGDAERFGAIVRSAVVVPLTIAVCAVLASLVAARPLLHLILPSGAPLLPATHYLQLRACCLIPMMISGTLLTAAITAGNAGLAWRLLLVVNLVHVPLVFVLALGWLTHRPLGLAGAGLSSLIAELTAMIYIIVQTQRQPALRIFARWTIDRSLVRHTAALSWPEFVFLTLQIAPEPVTIALLAPSGTEAVAAFRALAIISDVTWSLPGALGDAAEVIIGQRIGANDFAGATDFTRSAIRISITACLWTGLSVAALAWPLAAACTLDPRLATLAALPLAVHAGVTLPLKGWSMSALAPIRAAGDTRFVMLMGILVTAIAVGGIALGIAVVHWGLWSVPFGWTAAWIVRALVTTARLRSGDWRRRRLTS